MEIREGSKKRIINGDWGLFIRKTLGVKLALMPRLGETNNSPLGGGGELVWTKEKRVIWIGVTREIN